MSVYWLLAARESLRAASHGQQPNAADWIERINRVLADAFPGHVVIVRDRYSGYRPFYGLVILLIEVQPTEIAAPCRFCSPGTYIVKVAFGERLKDLKAEIDAWNNARPNHIPFDNVFVALDAHPNDSDPELLVYGDANVVLGQRDITGLEEAMTRACRFGVPAPESIDRVLRTLYQRMNEHFFPHSHLEQAEKYLKSPRPDLKELIDRYDERVIPQPKPEYRHDLRRRQHRRETLALLAREHESFADPIDLLAGMRKAGVGPEILRGIAHGDLHGRNVQVSIVNDEVSQCAVYDYERFHTDNFPAWDFIKLEIETTVRMLDRFGDSDMAKFVSQCLIFWRHVASQTSAFDRNTSRPLPSELRLPSPEWDRLASRIVHLRILAYENLGRDRRRVYDWLDEYELLLVWYACRAAVYPNYEPRWTVAALVAAGVAARRLIRRLPAEVELSHRRRFTVAREQARSAHMVAGEEQLIQLVKDFPHVLEIQEELALVQIKLGKYAAAEAIISAVEENYDHTTAETPSRLGSLWKRRAYAVNPPDRFALDRALTWYQRAVEQEPRNFYPRINVATLMLILGRPADTRKEAKATLDVLELDTNRDHWWCATQGEAMLLLGEDADAIDAIDAALDCYRRAMRERDCLKQDRKTMRDQLEFLRSHLPPRVQVRLDDATLDEIFSKHQDDTP